MVTFGYALTVAIEDATAELLISPTYLVYISFPGILSAPT
jgi:hypothetical protein